MRLPPLLLFLALFLPACSRSDPQVKFKTLLATYTSPDRSDTFSLWAEGLYNHAAEIDQESCAVSNLRLVVIRTNLHPSTKWNPLELEYPGTRSYRGFGPPPLWDRQYIPLGKFALPSGEFFIDERPVLLPAAARDDEAARRLWEISARMTGLPAD